jgi:hypothetical protein
MKHHRERAGYAMLLVLLFLVLMFSLMAFAYGQLGAALRLETARAQQMQRDEGSIQALGKGLALLETGLPPTDPYVCGVAVNTSTGSSSFTVTFRSEGGNHWSVHSAPTTASENPQPMPVSFAP